jgi:hypothetical protein
MSRRRFRLWRRNADGPPPRVGSRGPHDGGQKATTRPGEKPAENVGQPLHPLSRREARRRERIRQAGDQALAWRVQDVLVGCGLTRMDFSIGGGRTLHAPEVVSVSAGPPVRLTIRTLPGQTPDDFARHAPAIAYNLGVAQVRVLAQGPLHIGLELLPEPD